MNDLENLRLSFRPHRITTLFVGESPPHGGTFFYRKDSLLYHKMRESFDAGAAFLSEFKAKGFYLDDLVLCPINQMEEEIRNKRRWKGASSLALRIADYRPAAVVALMIAIKPMVWHAICTAHLSQLPLYVVPFPRPEHQKRFKTEMAEIIQMLPIA